MPEHCLISKQRLSPNDFVFWKDHQTWLGPISTYSCSANVCMIYNLWNVDLHLITRCQSLLPLTLGMWPPSCSCKEHQQNCINYLKTNTVSAISRCHPKGIMCSKAGSTEVLLPEAGSVMGSQYYRMRPSLFYCLFALSRDLKNY